MVIFVNHRKVYAVGAEMPVPGFDLTWADRLRKSIAKKNPADYEELQKNILHKVEEKRIK